MTSTGYFELDRLPSRCAQNYIYCADTKDYRTNIFSVDAKGTGAGGAFITVKDIVRFWTNLLSGNLFDKALVTEMLRRQSGDGFISEYNIEKDMISVLVSNYGDNVWQEMRKIREIFY